MTGRKLINICFGPIFASLAHYDSATRARAERAIPIAVDKFYGQVECQAPGSSCTRLIWEDGFTIAIEAWFDLCVVHRIYANTDPFDVVDIRFAVDGAGRKFAPAAAVSNTTISSEFGGEDWGIEVDLVTPVSTMDAAEGQLIGAIQKDVRSIRQIILATDCLNTTVGAGQPVAIYVEPVRTQLSTLPPSLFSSAMAAILSACDAVFKRCPCLLPGNSYAGIELQGDFAIHYEMWAGIFKIYALHRPFPTKAEPDCKLEQ